MLNFIAKQAADRKPKRPLLKFQPQMVYGHTRESPQHFLQKHTIYYENPSFRKPKQSLPVLTGSRKKDILQFVGQKPQPGQSVQGKDRQQEVLERQLEKAVEIQQSKMLRSTKKQFTQFMDRHKHYGSLGVIHRNEGVGMRSTQSFFEKDHQGELSNTRPLWNNSINTQTKSLFGSSKTSAVQAKQSQEKQVSGGRDSMLGTYAASSILTRSNSMGVFQRAVGRDHLKLRRQQFLGRMRDVRMQKEDQRRKQFQLPRVGVQHQLFFLQQGKRKMDEPKDQLQEINAGLQKFQKSLFQKFKIR